MRVRCVHRRAYLGTLEPTTYFAQPNRVSHRVSDYPLPNEFPNAVSDDTLSDGVSYNGVSHAVPVTLSNNEVSHKISNILSDDIWRNFLPDGVPDDTLSNGVPDALSSGVPDALSDGVPDSVTHQMQLAR